MTMRFAFVSAGKDPDEILSSGGSMDPIIAGAKLLPDFIWESANRNFQVANENGRVQADKWIRGEYEKIPDLLLRNEYLATLKNREWDGWNKYRRTIAPEMKTPDPAGRMARMASEIRRKFPDLYDANFELLGAADASDPSDTRMTRDRAVRIIKEVALGRQLHALIAERADAAEIQRVRDAILEVWS
jgi:hypothetical protein